MPHTFFVEGKILDIPDYDIDRFKGLYPDAEETKLFLVGDERYDIPLSRQQEFLSEFPQAVSADKKRQEIGVLEDDRRGKIVERSVARLFGEDIPELEEPSLPEIPLEAVEPVSTEVVIPDLPIELLEKPPLPQREVVPLEEQFQTMLPLLRRLPLHAKPAPDLPLSELVKTGLKEKMDITKDSFPEQLVNAVGDAIGVLEFFADIPETALKTIRDDPMIGVQWLKGLVMFAPEQLKIMTLATMPTATPEQKAWANQQLQEHPLLPALATAFATGLAKTSKAKLAKIDKAETPVEIRSAFKEIPELKTALEIAKEEKAVKVKEVAPEVAPKPAEIVKKEVLPEKPPKIPVKKEKVVEVKPTAEFIGYQETVKGPPFALYNIKGGKFDKSTVSAKTLKREGIKIPETPPVPKKVVKPPVKESREAFDILRGTKEKTSTLPKYARSVNLEKQNIPEALKQFQVEVGKLEPKKVQTWTQTEELSKRIQPEKVLQKAKKKQPLKTEEFEVIRQVNVNAMSRLKEMAETLPKETFDKSFKQYVEDIFTPLSNASSEAGRALNIHKKEVSINRIGKAFSELKRGMNERELAEFKKVNFENPLEVSRFIDRLGDPRLRDYMYEYWYNSILSGIPTHVVNITSNTAWGLFQIPHRGLTAGVDAMISKFTGKERTRYLGEMIPMFAGYKSGFLTGKQRAAEIIRTGAIGKYETKWSIDIGGKAISAFERSPYKFMRTVAPFISAPTRALRAMDVWANSIAFDVQLNALARREALNKVKSGKLKKENMGEFEKKFVEKPSESTLKDSKEFARYNTFMDDPGKFTSWIIGGRDIVPGGRFVIPFVNTIANLTKRGVEMIPGVGLTLARRKNPAEVIAKQIEGAIITLYILHKLDKEEVIGRAPKSKAERESFYDLGKLPWSIKYGDEWIQYRRMEPYNTVIASVAIAYEEIKKADDEITKTEIFGNTVDGIVDNLLDSSYLQGLTRVLNKHESREGILQRQLASFVPYSSFWRSINRSYEVMTEGETKVRETRNMLGAFTQVIPGLSDKSPSRINVWGEEIVLPGGVLRQWLPYKWSKETEDPLEIELERLSIYPGLPGKTVTIKGVKITFPDDFYRDYAIKFGKEAKTWLDKIIVSERYRNYKKDEYKIKYLDSELTKIRLHVLKEAKKEYRKLHPE